MSRAGAVMQAIGFRASQVLYFAMLGAAYAVAGMLAATRYKGSALAFLTLPLAISALKGCKPEVRGGVLMHDVTPPPTVPTDCY